MEPAMRTYLLALVAFTIAGASAWLACASDQAQPEANSKAASRSGAATQATATGTLEPEEVIDVYSDVAGRILSLGTDPQNKEKTIDFGSPVEAGTVLAYIDTAPYKFRVEQQQAAVMLAQAELDQARAKLELAEAQIEQVGTARESGSIPESDLRAARANHKVAMASVAAAEAALAQKKSALGEAQRNLCSTTILSPVKGVVLDRRVNKGQMATAGANSPSLFLIADISKLELRASVNEADIGKIHAGQSVRFTVDALPGKVFEGKVKQIRLNAVTTHNVVTYTVIVSLSTPAEGLLPYMTADPVEFE
jgi:HlyD family secretion protein